MTKEPYELFNFYGQRVRDVTPREANALVNSGQAIRLENRRAIRMIERMVTHYVTGASISPGARLSQRYVESKVDGASHQQAVSAIDGWAPTQRI